MRVAPARGRRRRPGRRGVRAVVVVSVSLALAAALYHLGTGGRSGEEAPAARPGAAEVVSADLSPGDLPPVPALRQVQGAVADLRYEGCDVGAGQQQVTGTVENSAARPRDIVVTINWITDTFGVVGRGVAVLEGVEPGGTAAWEISAVVAEGASRCVANVRRGILRN